MSYATIVLGCFRIDPPLNEEEVAYLQAFNATRRVLRDRGPYAVHDDRSGQERLQPRAAKDAGADVIDIDVPAEGQPGLWCPWTAGDDGRSLGWDGQAADGEALASWLMYLLEHFMTGRALRAGDVQRSGERDRLARFTFDHGLFGVAEMHGEDPDDRWALSAHGFELLRHEAVFAYHPPLPEDRRLGDARRR